MEAAIVTTHLKSWKGNKNKKTGLLNGIGSGRGEL